MKKLKIILTLSFLSVFSLNAQNLSITYKVTVNANDAILSTSTNYDLILNGSKSAYYNNNDSLKQFKYQSFINETKKIGELTRVKLSDNHYAYVKQDFFFKDYEKDTLIYNELIVSKKAFVGEKINLIDWKIQSKSDTIILNQKCLKAIGKFRGRTYDAYFSPSLSQRGGPWKFDGLPGIILSVKSQDDYFVIEPTKIVKNSKSQNTIFNVYDNKKAISWALFKKRFKEKLIRQFKKLKSLSEDGEKGSIEITDRIEDLGIGKLSF
ncbi:MAG: GLPGLI family protein [Flavobacteriaceae bacterium]